MTPAERSIVYFDGLCNLCDGFVRFLLARDRRHRYRFASLQGETARTRLGERFAYDPQTIVFEQPRRFLVRSDAVLAMLGGLGGPWRAVVLLRAVPRRLRDAVYDHIARKRLEWYGRRDACRVPAPEAADYFLP